MFGSGIVGMFWYSYLEFKPSGYFHPSAQTTVSAGYFDPPDFVVVMEK